MSITTELCCHPEVFCSDVQSLQVTLDWLPESDLYLQYRLTADLNQILIPTAQPPGMADGLWEHTCFEAFIARQDEEGYREFNFSPSGQWAAYDFSGYRLRNQWQAAVPPRIRLDQAGSDVQLDAVIAEALLPPKSREKPLQIGLAAVIETVGGIRSYWALHHPAPHPDFHHRGGFVQSFAAAFAKQSAFSEKAET